MTGGWIAWWHSELELYHNTRPIARVAVVLRECRHFVLMWYVVALELDSGQLASSWAPRWRRSGRWAWGIA
ncbi:hypothetical protein PsorP6_018517 [Peronosclerospora sorghi]|nr:hypothetical protein PsorP6_018517 [Peronosclerospora sorghi]